MSLAKFYANRVGTMKMQYDRKMILHLYIISNIFILYYLIDVICLIVVIVNLSYIKNSHYKNRNQNYIDDFYKFSMLQSKTSFQELYQYDYNGHFHIKSSICQQIFKENLTTAIAMMWKSNPISRNLIA